jgi:protein-S-isoprenylcysteine O-methyltransferase Ste14
MNKSVSLPQSATNVNVSIFGFFGFFIAVIIIKLLNPFNNNPVYSALFIIMCFSFFVAFLEIFWQKVFANHSSGLDFKYKNPSISRSFTKITGFLGSLSLLALLYWVFPEYHGDFYAPFREAVNFVLPVLVCIAPFYIYLIDRHMLEPADGYWYLGLFLTFRFSQIDYRKLWQHILGWIVKGFFLPLMFVYMCNDIKTFIAFDFHEKVSFQAFLNSLSDFLFFVDVTIATAGYIFSLRITDTHIRSTEPTVIGWVVALICYQPFYSLIGEQYLDYHRDYSWNDWLESGSLIYYAWGSLEVFMVFVYAWATVSFGLRFSNLTNRGIITSGPYRWTKHPAYLAKNISWWMISVPFIADGAYSEAIRNCILLGLLNFCYYLRARTEEKHLSTDQNYTNYAEWIAENGIIAKIKRVCFRKNTY